MEVELPPAVPRYLKDEWIEWTLSYPEGGSEKEKTRWVLTHPLYTHKLHREPKGLRRSLEESKQPKLSADSHPFPPEPKGKSLKEESMQPKSSADSHPFPPSQKIRAKKRSLGSQRAPTQLPLALSQEV